MGKRPAGEAPHLPKIIFAYSLASAACFPFPFSRRDQYRCGRSAHSSGVIPSRDTTNGAYFKHFLISDGKKKFEKLNIQIRDPQALESLSEIDMICFDKTGVLTTRNMEVKRVYYGDRVEDLDPPQNADIPSELILMGCALCNEVLFLEKMDLANPIDKALIAFAQKTGIGLQKLHDQYKRVYDQPFDSENRSMACGFERGDHEIYFFMKGDPAVIVNKCTHYLTSTGATRRVDFDFLTNITMNIETINLTGGTVIALAYSPEVSEHPPENLTFLCLLQLENLLQPGVREMIRRVSEQRIRSVLLTGDRAETAARVGVECGIAKDPRRTLTGRTIQYMALAEVARQSAYCSVFARLLPSQKAVLVRMFQQEGHSVAMIGDGTNDGLALKAADIGISFLKNSSPFARRLSKILINELPDVLTLLEGSHRLNKRIGNLETIRLLAMAGVLFGVYGCALALYYF
jgi:P-type Ca2+ transporter type 2C